RGEQLSVRYENPPIFGAHRRASGPPVDQHHYRRSRSFPHVGGTINIHLEFRLAGSPVNKITMHRNRIHPRDGVNNPHFVHFFWRRHESRSSPSSRGGGLGQVGVLNVPLSVHYGYGGHIDDFFHSRAALQHVDRL